MHIVELLRKADEQGVQIRVAGDDIVLRYPQHGISDDLRNEIKRNKQGILEQLLTFRGGPRPDLEAQPRPAVLPLSFAQERLWFLEQLELLGPAYNMPSGIRLHGSLDAEALERSLAEVVSRHEILRTRIVQRGDEPAQTIDPPGKGQFEYVDLTTLASEHREQEVQRRVRGQVAERFRLDCPLFKTALLKLGPLEHVMLMTMHHIVSDGWSMGVLIQEIGALYAAFSQGKASPLSPLQMQYADYALWQRRWLQGEVLERELVYWRQKLAGIPAALDLPTDRPRPAVASFKGARIALALPRQLSVQLQALARHQGATLFMVLLAAYQVLLSRLSGQRDIVVGSPIAGRTYRNLEGLIGFFANTLALRAKVNPDAGFRELLRLAKEATLGAYEHQELPFEKLVAEIQPGRDTSRQPLYQVAIALQNVPQDQGELAGIRISRVSHQHVTAKSDLMLFAFEDANGIQLVFEYATDLFEPATMTRWMEYLQRILQAVANNPDCRVADLPLMGDAERDDLLVARNATEATYRRDCGVHQLVSEQAARTPDAAAVVDALGTLSFSELDSRANQLARHLKTMGVGPEVVVAVCLRRSVQAVVVLLGILKAGGAYLPLDEQLPAARLQQLIQDAGVGVLVSESTWRDQLPAHPCTLLVDDDGSRKIIDALPVEDLAVAVHPENAAYVIYTSGSTGQPKGVVIPHRAVCNLVEAHRRAFAIGAGDRLLQFTRLGFDVSVQEILVSLSSGAALHIWEATPAAIAGTELARFISEQSITTVMLPSSLLPQLPVDGVRSLCRVFVGGEAFDASLAEQWASRGRFINEYGTTEATVCSTYDEYTADGLPVSIGRPLANTRVYVLDEDLQPVPSGAIGELFIGGEGIGRGYLQRAGMTADRFVAEAYGRPGSRMYRTGDRVRYRTDGKLEFIGRADYQLKIRGHRIEPGEIETALLGNPQVSQAVVEVREDRTGDKRLIAYVATANEAQLQAAALKKYLEQRLPQYMVPSTYVILERLPLTQNGKVDRQRLPVADLLSEQPYEAPEGALEQALAAIWQELLQVERVGRHDNFFDLGGHSMLVVKALARTNQFVESAITATDLYRYPTIQLLAVRISAGATPDEPVSLAEEAVLDASIVPGIGTDAVAQNAILLTGCTGFVGRFLLAQLLQDTDARIYCLVRAPSAEQAFDRVRDTLLHWDLWQDSFASRLVAVPGDISLPRLGLNAAVYEALCQNIDTLFHNAASMNHLETYAMAKPANVEGAKEVLKFAVTGRQKQVNYISTLGVFGAVRADGERAVDEASTVEHEKHPALHGYNASKWIGEHLVMQASQRGVPCNIFRLGLVSADTAQGRYDERQWAYRLIKSCLLSGYGLRDFRYSLPPTPVDYVARSVVHLAKLHRRSLGVFHISSSQQTIEGGLFENCNEITGANLQLIPFYDWMVEIRRLHQQGRMFPAVPLMQFAFTLDKASWEAHRRSRKAANIRFDFTRTHGVLDAAGIVAPVFSRDQLKVALEGMISRDSELRANGIGLR
ncbi:non-ribosomal peptide synthetase [Dyella tabacisoli]|uniref:Amino acid adenylation domain-containing protein n=1 Tax=Dyella tabacisoli TaxID=2282381 RepID=A0A369UJX2_9GAMM|nr:non-ribosomal peptide synthetase [Dyella tabacisoli]RDD80415.1 amino acid adenylation domain-containing protein [Dyella tabacisoli]